VDCKKTLSKAEVKELSNLLLSLEIGYEDIAEQQIIAGAEINSQNSRGYTPIMIASQNGYVKIISLLTNISHFKLTNSSWGI
jgi:ankyrin repeat protein